MAKTIEQLKAQGAEVKNATVVGENTATRVGTLFNDIVEHVEDFEAKQAQRDTKQNLKIDTNSDELKNKTPKLRDIEGEDDELDISDEHGYIAVKIKDGHIRTKEFDSRNAAKSDATPQVKDNESSDLDIADENDNILARFKDGHIRTKEFDSRKAANISNTPSIIYTQVADLDIADEEGNVIVRLKDGHIKTKEFDSRNAGSSSSTTDTKPVYEMKPVITGFSSFTGANWVINNDSAYTTSTGNSNRLYYSKGATLGVMFNINVDITPEGSTFECGVGKFYSLGGGMFTINKTSSGSYVKLYVINNIDGTIGSTEQTYTISNFTLTSGRKYNFSIKRRTNDFDEITIKITDTVYGYFEEFKHKVTTTAFRLWGVLGFYMISGSKMTVSNFSFWYQNPEKVQMLISGHSFVEGNSIPTEKEKLYVKQIAKAIGLDFVAISGRGGGETAELAKGLFKTEASLLGNPKYVFFNTGTNDGGDANTQRDMETLKTQCSELGITPIWATVSPDLRNGENRHETINAWIKTQPYYLDIASVFYNTDGSVNTSALLSDKVHPTIETHAKIANLFIGKFIHLFTIKNN